MVHVWICNSKGEYLISQHSANRPTYPLMWKCIGGSVVKGEVDLGNTTTDEVAQVVWMSREQIKGLFEYNMFVETLEYFFTEVDK